MNETQKESELPSECCEDLDLLFDKAWKTIEDGVADRHMPAHTPTLATTGNDGLPKLRTIVVRHVSKSELVIRFHTDIRSSKAAELRRQSGCCIHVYDKAAGLQLRFDGYAELHHESTVAKSAWDGSSPMSRKCYGQLQAPGAKLADPNLARLDGSSEGFQNFCAVLVNVTAVDLYALSHTGHRRAHWTVNNGTWTGHWLAP
ncbi:MAG: pyridoxamine 5'-phosphate oxidase family protein [Rhizobiaceae bacterium]